MQPTALSKLDGVSLRDLRALVALADERHFGHAASRLGISQPSLSAAISKLESCLKVRIFERTSRRVTVTNQGAALIEQAREVLRQLTAFAELAEPNQEPLTRRLRLGVIPTVAPYYLPHVLQDLVKDFPLLELSLREEISERLILMLRQGELDAALLTLPWQAHGLEEFPLFQEELSLAVPRNHALAGKRRLSVTEIPRRDLILLEHGHCLREQTLELCGADLPSKSMHATSMETMRFMVQAEIGTAIVPALAVHWDSWANRSDSKITYLQFEEPAPSRMLGLIMLSQSPARRDVEQLVLYLRKKCIPERHLDLRRPESPSAWSTGPY